MSKNVCVRTLREHVRYCPCKCYATSHTGSQFLPCKWHHVKLPLKLCCRIPDATERGWRSDPNILKTPQSTSSMTDPKFLYPSHATSCASSFPLRFMLARWSLNRHESVGHRRRFQQCSCLETNSKVYFATQKCVHVQYLVMLRRLFENKAEEVTEGGRDCIMMSEKSLNCSPSVIKIKKVIADDVGENIIGAMKSRRKLRSKTTK